MKIILFISVLLITSFSTYAQTAKIDYTSAMAEFGRGNYKQAITYANSAKSALGNTNPKIESLLMVALFEDGDIINAKIAYETLLKVTPYSKQQSDSFQQYLNIGKQINEALKKEETKFQDNKIKEQKRSMIRANQIEDAYKLSFDTKNKEQRKGYLNKRIFRKIHEQNKYDEFSKLNSQFGITLSSKEKEEIKQEKLNIITEGALDTKEIYFSNRKYYLINYLSKEYALFNNSGEMLIDKTDYIISYLGDGYFEINGYKDQKENGVEVRKSILYDIKKKLQTAVLILVVRPNRKYVELHDENGKKMGFLYGSTLLLPKYDEFLLYGGKSNGFFVVVQNNNLEGVIGTYGEIIVPVKYAKVTPKGPLDNSEYWCRTVEDYKIADKYNYKGQYLGTYKMHKNGNYIKKL